VKESSNSHSSEMTVITYVETCETSRKSIFFSNYSAIFYHRSLRFIFLLLVPVSFKVITLSLLGLYVTSSFT